MSARAQARTPQKMQAQVERLRSELRRGDKHRVIEPWGILDEPEKT